MPALAVLAAGAALLAALFAGIQRVLNRGRRVAQAVIVDPEEHTTMDADGAVRSIQAADLTLPERALDEIWSPRDLERLARTYWRFLTRATLGLVRVHYREQGRDIVLIGRPLVLLSFHPPDYEMDDMRGIVRWRIDRGLLVSSAGRGRDGYLEIDIQRRPADAAGHARLHVEVEVANFYPSLASAIARWFYQATQSRIHVIITHAFLRSLAHLDLAESKVGRFASVDEVPDPAPERRRESPAPRPTPRPGRGSAR